MKETGMSIRTRILTWMILLSLVPLAILAVQGYHCARQALIDTQQKHLNSLLQTKMGAIQKTLEMVRSDLHLLSIVSFPEDQLAEETESGCTCGKGFACTCNPLPFAMEDKPYYSSLTVFNANWESVSSSGIPLTVEDLPDQFRSQLATSTDPLFLTLDGESHGLRLVAGCPMTGQHGEPAPGFIVASLKLAAILKPVLSDTTGLGKSGHVFVYIEDGSRLALQGSSIQREQVTVPFSSPHREGTIHSGNNPIWEADSPDNLILGQRIDNLPWTLVIQTSRMEAFHWLTVLRDRAIGTGLLTFLVVILIAYRIAHHLSEPFQQLSNVAGEVANGEMDARVPPLPGKEPAQLSHAFNQMLDAIAGFQQRLAHAASLAAIGELSSSVVHEMRNPLSSIKINLQALAQYAKDDSDHHELADIALAQVSRLETMLNELLDFGKPLQLDSEPVAVSQLIQQARQFIQPLMNERDIRLDIDNPIPDAVITADPEQMTRALVNLFRNAVEASPDKSTIEVRVSGTGPQLLIEVLDRGSGIPDHIKKELFKPFVTGKKSGTGLGLANVKKIIQAHGGDITADNREQGGACFAMRLTRMKGTS